jgi:hypothetical protein
MALIKEALYAGQIAINDLPQLVANCGFLPSAFVLIERLPQQVITKAIERQNLLRFTHYDRGISFADYTSGRVFDGHAELRWEKQGNMMQVVYLGSKEHAEALLNCKLQASHTLDKLKPAVEKKYFLFGERINAQDLMKIGTAANPGDFAEVRIPRLLQYPVPQNEQRYVRLVVREYLDEEGRVVLFRFQDLKQWS